MNLAPIRALALGAVCLSVPACDRLHHELASLQQVANTHEKEHSRRRGASTQNRRDFSDCQERGQHPVVRLPDSLLPPYRGPCLESGYLEEIPVKEGQSVRQGDSLFKVVPALYQAKLDTELAEAQLVQIEFNNAKRLFDQKVVSQQEVALAQAKLAKAQAQVKLAQAELNFANIKAPFQGIIDRLMCQQGSLVAEGDVLTTLSDNSVMWVYFNVPEARYLEYKTRVGETDSSLSIELLLADHSKFKYSGNIGAIEADFNHETGNIAFRADFPNPEGLLRHGQTGNVLIHRMLKDAVVIPQRARLKYLRSVTCMSLTRRVCFISEKFRSRRNKTIYS